jgi:adenosylcobinamide-phosphate synthase
MPVTPGAFGSADPLILLLLAFGIEGYLGGAWLNALLAGPRARLVRAARALQRRLDRPERGRRTRLVRGWIVTLALLLPPLAAGAGLEIVTRNLPYAALLELPLVAALVRQRGPWQAAAGVRDALAAGSAQLAGDALSRLDPPPEKPGTPSLTLAARTADALGERFADAAVAPAFAYLLLGLPGLLAAASLRLLARLYDAEEPFGRGAYLLVRVLFWPARRIAALLLALATLFQVDDAGGGPSSATALGRALAGATPGAVLRPTLRDEATATALARAMWQYGLACLLFFGVVAGLLVLRLNLA